MSGGGKNDGSNSPGADPHVDPEGEGDDVPSIDVHQPGDREAAALGPRDVDGDPPDAVGGEDDRSAGPEDRAPEPPG